MDAPADAVGKGTIMDAPLAASSFSRRFRKNSRTHSPLPAPPLPVLKVDRHNWTKKYEETGRGFPPPSLSLSLSLSPPRSPTRAASFLSFELSDLSDEMMMVVDDRSCR